MKPLAQRLKDQIREAGPLTIAQFMAACLYDPQHGYYARAPRIGAEGDFITAPVISQMFGELIGLWCVHEWDAMGRPPAFHWIELGPGTGALIADAWRATRVEPAFRAAARLHLVEVSPALRIEQARALARLGAQPRWHDALEDVPLGPSLMVANEFFDCMPIRQFVRESEGWRERLVGLSDAGDLSFGLLQPPLREGDPMIPPSLIDAPQGAIAEHAPGLAPMIDLIAARLRAAPGRALVIDYAGDGSGDTLQAVRAHQKESPLAAPGEADLTARVDFTALKILARASGLGVAGAATQGDFLRTLGLDQRAQALAEAHPDRAERIAREHARLTGPDQMGALFKVLCLSSPVLPPPAGL
jgi:NADH dehydrogenase [ubiquinone] 1 alpha subcomplex assembly factor 7